MYKYKSILKKSKTKPKNIIDIVNEELYQIDEYYY
jgi:hypothetical protein